MTQNDTRIDFVKVQAMKKVIFKEIETMFTRVFNLFCLLSFFLGLTKASQVGII